MGEGEVVLNTLTLSAREATFYFFRIGHHDLYHTYQTHTVQSIKHAHKRVPIVKMVYPKLDQKMSHVTVISIF